MPIWVKKITKRNQKEIPYKPVRAEGIMRCKCRHTVFGGENYCSNCGQRLDWSK